MSTGTLDGTVTGAVTTATQVGNWAGSLGQEIATGTTAPAYLLNDDFSTDNWTNVGGQSNWGVSSGTMEWTTARGTTQGEVTALSSSTDDFVLRYKFTPTNANHSGGNEEYLWVGLSDNNSCTSNTAQEQAGVYFHNWSSSDSKFQVTSGSSGLFSGAVATSINFSSTEYWIEIIKSGSDVTLQLYSDAYTTPVSGGSATSSNANGPYDYVAMCGMTHSTSGSGSALGTIDDMTVTADVTTYTYDRAEQYQSGTTTGDATIMDDDLTTDPGFVYMNSGTTAQHDSGNGEIDIAYSGTTNPAYAYYDLGTPLGDTWSMQFDLRRNSGSNQDFTIGFADDSGWTGTPGNLASWGSGDWAGVRTVNNCAVTVYEYNDGSSSNGSQGTNCPSIGTWETYTVTYDSSLLKVEVTNHLPSSSGDYEVSSTGATGLQYLTMSARQPGGVAWGENVSVDNIKICDGTTDPTTCQAQVPVYSYYNFGDLGFAEDTEKFVGQEFGSGSSLNTAFDGTNNGATTAVTGKLGNAWDFDGSNDYVTVPAHSTLIQGQDNFTISLWLNPDSLSGTQRFVSQWNSSQSDGATIIIQVDSSGYVTFYSRTDANQSNTITSSSTIPSGSWSHVAVVFYLDGSQHKAKMYIDGSVVASGNFDNNIRDNASGTPLNLGRQASGSEYLNGKIDQVLIYDSELSSSEISSLYNSGSGTSTPSTTNLIAHYDFEQSTDLENQVMVTSNAALIGTSIDNVQLRLEKVGSPTGTAQVGVWNSADTKVHDFGNYDMSTATATAIVVDPATAQTTTITPTEYVTYTGNHNSATCDENTGSWSGSTTGYGNMYAERGVGTAGWCVFPSFQYGMPDAQTIPLDKHISKLEFTLPITTVQEGTKNCSIYDTTIQPSTHYTDLNAPPPHVADILNGNKYLEDDSFCTTTGTKTVTLNQQALDDFNSAKQSGQTWFAIGFYYDDLSRDSGSHRVGYTSSGATLKVTFGDGTEVEAQGSGDKTFTSSTPYTIAAGDKLGMLQPATGSDDDNFVQVYYGKAELITNTNPVTWTNLNNAQDNGNGVITQTGQGTGGWQGWGTSDTTWAASDGFTVNIQELTTTGNGAPNYYDSNMIGITNEWTTIPGGASPAWNEGYKHMTATGNDEFVFFTESADQRRVTCGGTQNNFDLTGNIGADHAMKIEVLPSGTVNFYWDGSTTPLHTCSGASGDYRVYFGGYDGNGSGGLETTVTASSDSDYDSSLSKMVYGTFGALDEGLPAVQEQSQTSTLFDEDGSATTGWTDSNSILSSSGGDLQVSTGSQDHKAHKATTTTLDGDFTFKFKIGYDSGGDGGGIGVFDTTDSSWSGFPSGYAKMMSVYLANSGDLYTGTHTGSSWNGSSSSLCSSGGGTAQSLSTGDERWVTLTKSATEWNVKVYDDSARSNLVCDDTRSFTDGGTSMTGFNEVVLFTKWTNQSHNYDYDDIEITAITITQPYVAPITYDVRFQSTLGNAASGAGLTFDGNDYITTDLGSVINTTDQAYSISAWIKPSSVSSNHVIISNDSGGTSGGTNLYIHSSGQLRWSAGNTGTQVTGTTMSADTWYHVMATKSADGVATTYVNGVQDGQQTDWGTQSGQSTAWIGAQNGSGDFFEGVVDEFTFWDYELDYFAVETLYNQANGRDPSTLQNFILNNVKPVAYYNLDDGGATNVYPPAQTAPNTCEDLSGVTCDFSQVGTTPTFEDEFTTDQGWTITQAGSGGNNNAVNNNTLEFYMPYSNAGGTLYQDYIDLGVTLSTDYIVRFEVNHDQADDTHTFLGVSDSPTASANSGTENFQGVRMYSAGGSPDWIGLATNGQCVAGCYTSWAGGASGTGGSWATGTTDFFEISASGGTLTVSEYADSTYSGTPTSVTSTITSGNQGGQSYFVIKNTEFGSGWGSGANAGYIDNLRVYNGMTSATAPGLNHSVLHDGTLSGVGSSSGIVGKAMDFTGTSDYAELGEIGEFNFLHDGTSHAVSFWLYRDGGQASSEPAVIGTQGASSSYVGTDLWFDTSNNLYYYTANGGSSSTSSAIAIPDQTWTHVTYTGDGTDVMIYVNGVLTDTVSSVVTSSSNSSYKLTLGKNPRNGADADVKIDELYIFKDKSLTEAEVTSIYNAGLAGNQLSSAIVSTSGAGTYLIDESGVHDAVLATTPASGAGTFEFTNDTDYTGTHSSSISGNIFSTGHEVVGKYVTGFTQKLQLQQSSSGTYDLTFEAVASDGTVKHTFCTQDVVATLTTSWQEISCDEGSYLMQDTDTLAVRSTGQSSGDGKVRVAQYWSSSGAPVANMAQASGSGAVSSDPNADVWMKVDYIVSPASTPSFETGKVGTQALVSPQIQITSKTVVETGAVTIASNAFSPTPLSIPTGSTVTWSNTDNTIHQVETTGSTTGEIVSGNISASTGTFAHTFDTAGTYNYECPIHSSMTGQIVVADESTLPSGTKDFTVSAWTKATEVSTGLQQNFDSDAGWTQTGTLTSITGGELVMNSAYGGTPAGIEYDFGSPLSNQFVLQYEYTSPMTYAPAHYAGTMMSCSGDPDGCTGDKIGVAINGDWSTNGQGGDFSIVDGDNVSNAPISAGYGSGSGYINYNLNTKYFVEFIRNGQDMTLSVWDDSMNGSSQVGSWTETFTGTYTDIQYMSFSNQHNGNNVRGLSYNVDNLKFCDGVTSMSSCPMQGEIGTVLSFETQEAPTTSTQSSSKSVSASGSASTVADPSVGVEKVGNYISSTSTLIGTNPTDVAFGIYLRNGSGTSENIEFQIVDTNDVVQKTCDSSTLYNQLSTASWSQIQGYSGTNVSCTFDGTYSLQDGDKIVIPYTWSDSGTAIWLIQGTFTHSGEYYTAKQTGSWTEQSGTGITMDITYNEQITTPSPTKTTAFEVEPTKMRIVDIEPAVPGNIGFNNDYGSGWVNNNLGTPYGVVSTTANSIDIAVDNTSTSNYPHNSMNYELSSALSDEWVMRYSFTVDDKTSTMGNAYFNVMLIDDMWLGGGWDAQNENNGNGDFISAMYHVSSADNKWGTASADNFTHGSDISKTGITYTVGTTYYFELIRTSPTAFQVDYHGTSGFGTAQDSLSRSIASTIADLDTIAIGMPNQNGMGSWDISVNDIQVCDGQTDWANCTPSVPTVRTNILEQTVSLTPNDWKHVSWVRDGSSWKSIVDGTQVGSTVTQATSLGTPLAPSKTETVNNYTLTSSTGTTDWNFDNSFTCITDNSPKIDFTQGSCSDNRSASLDLGILGDTWEITGYTEWSGSYSGARPIFWIGVSDQQHICAGFWWMWCWFLQ